MGAAMCLIHPARMGSLRCDAARGGGARNDGATKAVAVVVLLGAFAVFAAIKGRGADLKIPMVVPKNGVFGRAGECAAGRRRSPCDATELESVATEMGSKAFIDHK